MQRTLIIDALNAEKAQNAITICGWVRTRRDAKGFSFVEINDGSCLANMQCIVDEGTEAHAALGEANTGAALAVGYESPTQFNREYKRMFGEPPHRDISRRHAQ